MTFAEAQHEFRVRYYLWSISEFESEIGEQFPNLKLFKAGHAWKVYQFMRLLDRGEQLTLAHAFVKGAHQEAVSALGENCLAEEKSKRSKYEAFWRMWGLYRFMQRVGDGQDSVGYVRKHYPEAPLILGEGWLNKRESLRLQLDAVFHSIPKTYEDELAARKNSGEKIKFASKRRLQKAIMEKFRAVFTEQITDSSYDDLLDPSSNFYMRCCGWTLSTHFWFGRRESLINYSHSLASPTTFEHRGNQVPTMVMEHSMSWLCMNQWGYISEGEVDSTCNGVIKLCSRFIDVAPKLLKGLEFDKIAP